MAKPISLKLSYDESVKIKKKSSRWTACPTTCTQWDPPPTECQWELFRTMVCQWEASRPMACQWEIFHPTGFQWPAFRRVWRVTERGIWNTRRRGVPLPQPWGMARYPPPYSTSQVHFLQWCGSGSDLGSKKISQSSGWYGSTSLTSYHNILYRWVISTSRVHLRASDPNDILSSSI